MKACKSSIRRLIAGSAIALSLLFELGPSANARQAETTKIEFAGPQEGRDILTAHDDYFVRMSSWDRSARMGRNQPVSEQAYVKFVGDSVLTWSPQEIAQVRAAWASLWPKLSQFSKLLPSTILFVKTNGDEEGHASYTRANAVFLPADVFGPKLQIPLSDVIAHEVFHVLSRNNPNLRSRLYAIVDFEPCGEIKFPTVLVSRKLTNPDAPRNDYCIHLNRMPGAPWAIPITFFQAPLTSVTQEKSFILSMELKFLIVRRVAPGAPATYDPGSPTLLDPNQLEGLYDEIGRNTGYIIHPEEILADNFEKLINGAAVPSPEIVRKLQETLASASR